MKNFFNKGVIYLLLWCLYNLQGLLFQSGGVISQSLLLILLVWSILHCFLVNFKKRSKLPNFIKAVNVFLIMATVYGTILILSGQELFITEGEYKRVPNFYYLKEVLVSLLPIYPIYYYVQKGYINERHWGFLVLMFICTAWGEYLRFQMEYSKWAMETRSTREEFTNNTGYTFLSILPLLLLWNRKPVLQYGLFLVCVAGIILCMKRGAIIIGIICFIYFIYSTIKASRGKTRRMIILLSVFAIAGTILLVQDMTATSEYFVQRLVQTLDGDTSNRDVIYTNLWNVFINESNPLKLLFGRGANATLAVGMNLAHNDWLELAINQGVLGLVVYVYYFISLLKDASQVRKRNVLDYKILLMSTLILFSRSLFSMSYSDVDVVLMLAIGIALGSSTINKKNYGNNTIIESEAFDSYNKTLER